MTPGAYLAIHVGLSEDQHGSITIMLHHLCILTLILS